MSTTTIANALRTLMLATVTFGATVAGVTTLGSLATADAEPVWVIGDPNAMQNCRATGGSWVWDGFEVGHCEHRDVRGPGSRAVLGIR